jgi:competence protein ComEC
MNCPVDDKILNQGVVLQNIAIGQIFAARFSRLLQRALQISASLNSSSAVLLTFIFGICVPLVQAELFNSNLLLTITGLLLLSLFWLRQHLIIVAAVVGLSWSTYHFASHIEKVFPAEVEGSSIIVEGEVDGLPRIKKGNVKFNFRVRDSAVLMLQGQRIQLSCYRCSISIKTGQTWRFTVRLKRPHGYASWGAFDYEKYLFRQQVVARGYLRVKEPYAMIAAAPSSTNRWRESIQLRLQEAKFESSLSKGLIAALSIGDRSWLTAQQRQVFQDTGVSHLMAISGLHVGLVFLVIKCVFGYLLFPFARVFHIVARQHLVLVPALLFALLYSALAGFAVSTQRAMLMLCIYVICRLAIREVKLLKILLIAATLMLLIDPFSILDTGFWMSCGAVAVIGLIGNSTQNLALWRLQPRLWLGMLPMTSLMFGQISMLSPLVNLVMVPLFCFLLVPTTLISVGLMQVGLTDVSLMLMSVLSYVFEHVFTGLEWLASQKFARLYTVNWGGWQWLGMLLIICSWQKRLATRWVCWVLAISLLFFSPENHLARGQMEIALMDVGQGLAVVVHSEDYVLVYDTGPKYGSGFSAAQAVLLPYLHSRGVRRIDALIISHADNDHMGGYASLVNALPVAQTISSRPDRIAGADACISGHSWAVGKTRFSILGPDASTPSGSNNRSCVLLLTHGRTRLLLTGDIEKQTEQYMLDIGLDLSADIVIVPHHGSRTSSTAEFIQAVKPSLGLISMGYANQHGHPHASVVQRYSNRDVELESTVENGSILLKINDNGWAKLAYRVDYRRFWHRQKKPNWNL